MVDEIINHIIVKEINKNNEKFEDIKHIDEKWC